MPIAVLLFGVLAGGALLWLAMMRSPAASVARTLRLCAFSAIGAATLVSAALGRWSYAIVFAGLGWALWRMTSRGRRRRRFLGGDRGEDRGEDRDAAAAAAAAGGPMTRAEALDVLGLAGDPDDASIHRAHREMMARVHPDVGGSEALAQAVNRARDILLQR